MRRIRFLPLLAIGLVSAWQATEASACGPRGSGARRGPVSAAVRLPTAVVGKVIGHDPRHQQPGPAMRQHYYVQQAPVYIQPAPVAIPQPRPDSGTIVREQPLPAAEVPVAAQASAKQAPSIFGVAPPSPIADQSPIAAQNTVEPKSAFRSEGIVAASGTAAADAREQRIAVDDTAKTAAVPAVGSSQPFLLEPAPLTGIFNAPH